MFPICLHSKAIPVIFFPLLLDESTKSHASYSPVVRATVTASDLPIIQLRSYSSSARARPPWLHPSLETYSNGVSGGLTHQDLDAARA